MNLLQAADVTPTAVEMTSINGARASAGQVMARWTAIKAVDAAGGERQAEGSGSRDDKDVGRLP